MRRNKILWSSIIIISMLLLLGYSIWGFTFAGSVRPGFYGPGYNGGGMMGRWFNPYSNQQSYGNEKKLPIEQIKNSINNYIQSFNTNLDISDIFIYKDTDYYVSIEEKDTGKGAMELLMNPYTGYVYPEYGPNMMWNEKYGMMSSGMMGGPLRHRGYGYYGQNDIKQISRDEAVNIADKYVKSSINKDFTVINQGHEFYGYYTFHISKGNKAVGMVSVNYHTGNVWYHDWHGQLENIISNDKE